MTWVNTTSEEQDWRQRPQRRPDSSDHRPPCRPGHVHYGPKSYDLIGTNSYPAPDTPPDTSASQLDDHSRYALSVTAYLPVNGTTVVQTLKTTANQP